MLGRMVRRLLRWAWMAASGFAVLIIVVAAVSWYQGESYTDPFTGRVVHQREVNWTFIAIAVLGITAAATLSRIARAQELSSAISTAAELERLGRLRADGTLTEAEFQTAKRRVLRD